ncbi:MAG: asparagine--tRNA ligase [Clostridiales bacterium]|jgi:asparaginyl-tRNA synthetase|nr:asparagine--tRNA ligase [Clostridiales bacterium]
MKRTEISQILKYRDAYIDLQLRVDGWVRTVRDSKNFGFIEINDGSCFSGLQILLERGALPNYQEAVKLISGSSISVIGVLADSPGGKQQVELRARTVRVVSASPPDYPLQKKRHSMEFLRGMPHLRARTNTLSAVFRIRSLMAAAVHRFFGERGFVYVHTPIITTSDSEGAGEMFRVTTLDPAAPPLDGSGAIDYSRDFFGRQAGLTVSGQLEAEAFAHAFGKVYTFGPTFRAENSNTPRHAAEFWMIEPEVAFADLADDMCLAEDMVKYVIGELLDGAESELAFLNSRVDGELLSRLSAVAGAAFARITYTEAIAVLERHNSEFEYKAAWGRDLQTEHERFLTEKILKRPVFVTDYPKDIKAFYMRQNDDGRTVAAMDLLVPGVGELIGGSQREERLDRLEQRIAALGMDAEAYRWYLDLRRYGGVAHSGFGLGFERAVMYMTGVTNIRDALPFPRTAGGAANGL